MNGIELEIEMVKMIKKELKNLKLQKPLERNEDESQYDYVTVYEGFPPPTPRGKENDDVPFIVARTSDGKDKMGDSSDTEYHINLEIVTYKNDDRDNGYTAHRNALLIWEKLRAYLRKNSGLGVFKYRESKWEILKLDGAFSGLAVDIAYGAPTIAEEETKINELIG